jgi:hypothetical protein
MSVPVSARTTARTLPTVVALVALVTTGSPGPAYAAEEVTVPPRVQAQLMAAVVSFQTNLNFGADGAVQILVLTKDGDAESDRLAHQLTAALGDMKKIMRRPHRETIEPFRTGAALVTACHDRRISVVYVAPGLGPAVPEIVQALRGSAVMTVGAVATYVSRGIVLGFDLVSGRAEMLFNPTQMRALNAQFPASIFQLMRIVE